MLISKEQASKQKQKIKNHFLLILMLVIPILGTNAQFNSPLARDINLAVELEMNQTNEIFFSSWKPYLQEHISQATTSSLAWNQSSEKEHSWWRRKLFEESFLTRQDTGYFLFLDPLFDFAYGQESATDRKLYTNTRGVRAGARLGKHFAFETDFYENQAAVPIQVDQFTAQWRAMPGQGDARRFKDTGWDYANATGYISWSPSKSHNAQFGHGKHFVGDGYRSLLLSDNAFNYPYLKYTGTFGCIQYTRTIASFMNTVNRTNDESPFPKKTAGFDYLTFNIGKHLQISLFESNIWQNPDSTGRFKPTWGIVNPIIFTNTLFTSNRDNIHSLVGVNVKCLVFKSIVLYGQLALDDVMHTAKKAGTQLGAKYYDVLGIDGFFLQAEYNQIAAGTYSFAGNTPISYTHNNQAIAHPLGNNFREIIAFASYNYRKFRIQYRFSYAKEKDPNAIVPNEFAVYHNEKKVIFNHIQAAWIINPRTMMQIAAGYTDRNETSVTSDIHTGTFFIAFRTALRNIYHDF